LIIRKRWHIEQSKHAKTIIGDLRKNQQTESLTSQSQ